MDNCTDWNAQLRMVGHSRCKGKIRKYLTMPDKVQGQGLPEYALLITLIAAVVVVVMALLGSTIKRALCDPLIALNAQYAASCLVEAEELSSSDGQTHSIAALAAYRSSSGELIIAARLPAGVTATLTVEGYGNMTYIPQKDVYLLVVQTAPSPSSVIINSSEGGSMVVEVRML